MFIVNLLHNKKRLLLPMANLVSGLLPPTRCFDTRNYFYKLAGLNIASTAKIVGGVKFHYHNISIGAETWISTSSEFITSESALISIGNRVDIAPGCFFNTGTHEIGSSLRRAGHNIANSIHIGDGTWIGMGAIILDGTSVGSGCIVAAGAVVRGQFPNNVLIGGVPARLIRELGTDESSSSNRN